MLTLKVTVRNASLAPTLNPRPPVKGRVDRFVTLSVTGCICINNASGFFPNIILIAYS